MIMITDDRSIPRAKLPNDIAVTLMKPNTESPRE